MYIVRISLEMVQREFELNRILINIYMKLYVQMNSNEIKS